MLILILKRFSKITKKGAKHRDREEKIFISRKICGKYIHTTSTQCAFFSFSAANETTNTNIYIIL